MNNKQHGFTIVELLIVIVVIGILAAIVIVAYNGVTNRANDNAVKSDLANLAKKMEAYKALNSSGLYPITTTDFYSIDKLRLSKGSYDTTPTTSDYNALVCMKDGGSYAILSASKSSNRFYISSSNPTPTSTTQTFSGGASSTCVALGVNPPTSNNRDFMYSGGSWNSNVK